MAVLAMEGLIVKVLQWFGRHVVAVLAMKGLGK